jgi:SAM-dependent methyltransferase
VSAVGIEPQAGPAKPRSGDDDYRAYVGSPDRYDVLAGAQFSMLLDAGLRENHRVVDIGCGSLRLGRLLIPFLRPGRYFGVEPNEWLVRSGFEQELGRDIERIKQPRFRYVDDFSLDEFGERFDFAIAYSVFTHCYPDLALAALRRIAPTLTERGLLVATYVDRTRAMGARYQFAGNGAGWLYPKVVTYSWDEFNDVLAEAGLAGVPVERRTPHKQSWFVATRADDAKRAVKTAERLTVAPDAPKPKARVPESVEAAPAPGAGPAGRLIGDLRGRLGRR